MKKVLFGVLTLGFVFVAAPAFAATTANVDVSATVVESCSITGGSVAFGNYDALSASPNDATGTVAVTCATGSTSQIFLGQGVNAGAGSTDAAPIRRMVFSATNFLSYQLYQEAGRTTVWGNTTATSPATATAANTSAVTSTIYGRVSAAQSSTVGAYTDTVVATVDF